MRIDDSSRIHQISLPSPKAQLLLQSVPSRRAVAVRDSSSRTAESASVIDAEYVEIYSTGKNALSYKSSALSSEIGIDEMNQNLGGQQQRISQQNMVNRYREMAADPLMPGKFLDIFA